MSIYTDGNIFPWELAIAVVIGAIVLYLGIRSTRRTERRRQRRMATQHHLPPRKDHTNDG